MVHKPLARFATTAADHSTLNGTDSIRREYPKGYNRPYSCLLQPFPGIINDVERHRYTLYDILEMKNNAFVITPGIAMTLSAQIKGLRKKAGLKQTEMAKRSGVGLRFVRDAEQGKATVRMDKVNQVLALFGYHLEAVKDHETSA